MVKLDLGDGSDVKLQKFNRHPSLDALEDKFLKQIEQLYPIQNKSPEKSEIQTLACFSQSTRWSQTSEITIQSSSRTLKIYSECFTLVKRKSSTSTQPKLP